MRAALIEGIYVEGDRHFRSDSVTIEKRVVHSFASLLRGSIIKGGEGFIPHPGSFDGPSFRSSMAFDRPAFKQPSMWAQVFFASRSLARGQRGPRTGARHSAHPWAEAVRLRLVHASLPPRHSMG